MTAHLYTRERTRQYLKSLIERKRLTSLYDLYVDENIRRSDFPTGNFYTKIVAEQGVDAAEAALNEWNVGQRMSDYASLIEPVARGMLALATADRGVEGNLVRLIDIDHNTPFPHHYHLREGKMVVLINQNAPGCGCKQPRGSDVFGPWGRIGIKAVVLSCDTNILAATELGIVLPVRGYGDLDAEKRRSGFVVVTVDLEGHTHADTLIPAEPDSEFLMKMLGLADGPIPRNTRSSGGHFDDAVGFPGATDYLANHLPKLEKYFADLAEKLSSEHKH